MNTIGHVFAHHAARLIIPLSSTLLETAWSTKKPLLVLSKHVYTLKISPVGGCAGVQMTEFGRLKRLKHSH